MSELRNKEHWIDENYRQRMTVKDWKQLLLFEQDTLIYHGQLRQLKAKSLGSCVVEVFKAPLRY